MTQPTPPENTDLSDQFDYRKEAEMVADTLAAFRLRLITNFTQLFPGIQTSTKFQDEVFSFTQTFFEYYLQSVFDPEYTAEGDDTVILE